MPSYFCCKCQRMFTLQKPVENPSEWFCEDCEKIKQERQVINNNEHTTPTRTQGRAEKVEKEA
jgi:hypothetical protein